MVEVVAYAVRRIAGRGKARWQLFGKSDSKIRAYPNDIRQAAYRVTDLPQDHHQCIDLDDLPFTGWRPGTGKCLPDFQVPLATVSVDATELDWFISFDDPEDTFAMHRFGWLLRWLSQRPPLHALTDAQELILDWIEKRGGADGSPAWETYSVSERVVNWLIFICATARHNRGSARFWQCLYQSLTKQLTYISENLEYYESGCNNHILNNARALYIGGQLLAKPGLANLGKTLLRKHTFSMIGENGELKEGSSHYQLILTRSFVEMVWVAGKTNDSQFLKRFDKITGKMVAFCNHLHPRRQFQKSEDFPRIGDLSPDFPVSWFFPSKEAVSWWNLWDANHTQDWLKACSHDSYEADIGDSVILNTIDVLDSPFFLTVTSVTTDGIYPGIHGHLDFGGFTMTDEWGAVLCDRGRYSYQDIELNRWGISAEAHNTSMINGKPLVPDCRGRYCAYTHLLKGTKLICTSDDRRTNLTWSTDAVKRLAKSSAWRRELIAQSSELTIEEKLHNPRRQPVVLQSHYHFAPGWTCDEKTRTDVRTIELVLKSPARNYSLTITANCNLQSRLTLGESGIFERCHSTDYGQRMASASISFTAFTDDHLLFFTTIKRI